MLYKNIEDEMGQQIKNIVRICSSWTCAYKFKNTLFKNIHPNRPPSGPKFLNFLRFFSFL